MPGDHHDHRGPAINHDFNPARRYHLYVDDDGSVLDDHPCDLDDCPSADLHIHVFTDADIRTLLDVARAHDHPTQPEWLYHRSFRTAEHIGRTCPDVILDVFARRQDHHRAADA